MKTKNLDVKILRKGKLVSVDDDHVKDYLGFPREGSLVGRLEHVFGSGEAIVVCKSDHTFERTAVATKIAHLRELA